MAAAPADRKRLVPNTGKRTAPAANVNSPGLRRHTGQPRCGKLLGYGDCGEEQTGQRVPRQSDELGSRLFRQIRPPVTELTAGYASQSCRLSGAAALLSACSSGSTNGVGQDVSPAGHAVTNSTEKVKSGCREAAVTMVPVQRSSSVDMVA